MSKPETLNPTVKMLLSKREAAEMLSVSERTIENLLARKALDSRKIGSRRLIVRASLERLARRDTPSPSPPRRAQTESRQDAGNLPLTE